ncbi:MAG: phenylacetate--CoA ligase, partial [Deltaproteobacteria bacterium]|nr:phenylacetate--CoA ligase [Deltaproteobacteria bacterium]
PRFLPHLPAERLAELQLTGIRWTVDHAMHSPQYRAKLQAVGIHAGADIRNLDDVRRLPFSSAADLCEGYPLPLLSVPERDVVRVHASSGTTGKRKMLAYTQNDIATFSLQMARCYELAGLTPLDRVQVAVGYGLWTAGVGFQLGSELFGALTIPVGPGNLDLHLQMLMDLRTTCLGATASMALLLAEEADRNNLRGKLALRKVIFGAEPHSLKMRRAFEEKLGLEGSYDIGGMTEMYGPGTSLNCDERQGLHYWGDLFYHEIVDPDTLAPVPDGQVGELVVTSLCKEATPLIRYRTHDLTRLIPEPCACGLAIPRHGHIRGRSDDMIIFRGVNIYPGQITDALHLFPEAGGEYHLVLTRDAATDHLRLQVERALAADPGDDSNLREAIARALHKKIMARIEVEIVDPGALPRTFSKAKRITDLRLE